MLKTLMWTLNLPDLILNDFSIFILLFIYLFGSFKTVLNREISILLVNLLFLPFGHILVFVNIFIMQIK